MKAIGLWIAKGFGALFVIAAVVQWLTFDYPSVNAWYASIFTLGIFGQGINWIIVCVLATIGVTLWTLGGTKKSPGGETK